MVIRLAAATVIVISAAGCMHVSPPHNDSVPALKSFEFLGCSGDFEGTELQPPNVWRVTDRDRVTFLTHHVAACGLEGELPRVSLVGSTLDLTYTLKQKGEAAILCDCEYWAQFDFGLDALNINQVRVNGESAAPQGTWPGR
jgi:hypothetical protein